MSSLQVIAFASLLVYFGVLLLAVTKEKRNQNVLDYFFGGRSMSFWTLSVTFIASWWGAGSAISTADLAYADGLGAFWYYGVPVLLATFLMVLFSKLIRRVGYLTQGEMFEARYSRGTSRVLAVMILIYMTFNAASQMVGIGQLFSQYLGICYEAAVILGTGIVLIYSMFGGFRGVVLTDIIQFFLLLFSVVVVFLVAMSESGGLEGIRAASSAAGKVDYMSLTAGAPKYMTYVITFGFSWMIQANIWQRISAARNDSDATKMTMASFLAFIPLYLVVVFTGMAGLAIFDKLPEGGVVTHLVLHHMSPLLGALVFVGISAAIMSTMDSLINTGAMTLAMDLYPHDRTVEQRLVFSRWSTLLVTGVALWISLGIRSILEIAWIASDVITTGVFVPLVAGFIWRRGNSQGAMASMCVGLLYCSYNLLIGLGVSLPACWERESPLQVVIGVVLSLVVYVSVSLRTAPECGKAEAFIRLAREGESRKYRL